jgi:PPM family protein phosphatase
VKLDIGQATDQGQVRGNNEDVALVDRHNSLFAVADGMGGHRGGEVASRTAVEAMRASFAADGELEAAIEAANREVRARAEGDDELTGMGTTLTAVTPASPTTLVVGHVGDSRAYLLRNGELQRITEDHSLVEELVRQGRLTPEQAESHPQKAIVTRALGVDSEVDVDLYPVVVETGDRIILCSDGLTDMVRDRDIERIARNEPDPQRAAEALVTAANNAGGHDNITVVIVQVTELDSEAAEASDGDAAPAAAVPVDVPPRVVLPPDVAAEPRPRRRPMRVVRNVALVLLPLLLILGAAAAVLGWYARGSYFVGAKGNAVVIYKGVPGGVLGWNPTVEEHTGLTLGQLSQLDRDRVQTNTARGSLSTARAYVARLHAATTTTSTTTSSTTTSTTVPRTTTTRRRP